MPATPRRIRRTLTIRLRWNPSYGEQGGSWVALDDEVAYGEGSTPQEAVLDCLHDVRCWLTLSPLLTREPARSHVARYQEWMEPSLQKEKADAQNP